MTLLSKKLGTATALLIGAIATLTLALHAQTSNPNPANGAPTAAPAPMPMQDEEGSELVGHIEGNRYVSPLGTFNVHIPVLPELGGQINDTQNVVTFQDAYGEHASIGCFPIDDTLRAEETQKGRKEFLVWFFQNYIQADFMRSIPGTTVEPNAHFINGTQGGALLTQLLLPNGSVFSERVFIFPEIHNAVAKRSNLVFINNNNVYVLSMELSDRIFEFSTYKKTPAEEEEYSRKQLLDLLAHINFKAVTPAPAANPKPAEAAPNVSFPASSGTQK